MNRNRKTLGENNLLSPIEGIAEMPIDKYDIDFNTN